MNLTVGPRIPNIRNFGGAAGNLMMRADTTGIGHRHDHHAELDVQQPRRLDRQHRQHVGLLQSAVFGTQDNFVTPPAAGHFTLANANQLTQYMLVNNATNLQNIATNTNGNYALGRDITDFTNVPNFVPIQTFNGKFDGLNQTITNLTIAPVNPVNFGIGVGMFAAIGATGVVAKSQFRQRQRDREPEHHRTRPVRRRARRQ